MLSNVDKFNYLNTYLESTAAESIAGLTLISANYEEAIATLKKRFGNSQLIVDKHMDTLLNLRAVTSHHDLRGLRRLYDAVETHVRGLRALGVSAESYGGLLSSILMGKLPAEIRLIISRELSEERGDVMKLKIVDREVEARERLDAASSSTTNPKRSPPRLPTLTSLMVDDSATPRCVFCSQGHQMASCTVVTGVQARREALRRAGRCYICLRRHHISRDCRSSNRCGQCRGRHHLSICTRGTGRGEPPVAPDGHPGANQSGGLTNPPADASRSTSTMYVDARTLVLLQTARLRVSNPSAPTSVSIRAIMDGGSQRTYVTNHVKETLHLSPKRTECLRIKTFGSSEEQERTCNAVDLGVLTRGGQTLYLSAIVVLIVVTRCSASPSIFQETAMTTCLGWS